MAQQLHQAGESVGLLALFDTGGPAYPQLLPLPARIASVFGWFIGDSWQRLRRGIPNALKTLQSDGFSTAWTQIAKKLKGLDDATPAPQRPSQQPLKQVSTKPVLAEPTSSPITSPKLTNSKSVSSTSETDAEVIANLLNRRFIQALERYQKKAKQNNQHSSLEIAINLLLARVLRRSSQAYYANSFTYGLSRQVSHSLPRVKHSSTLKQQQIKLQNAEALPKELQQVQAANRQARLQYSPQPYPGKVVLFRATVRAPGIYKDPYVGWRGMAKEGFEIHVVPGTHTSMVQSPILAALLKAYLEK